MEGSLRGGKFNVTSGLETRSDLRDSGLGRVYNTLTKYNNK